jgi:hypothetical protein
MIAVFDVSVRLTLARSCHFVSTKPTAQHSTKAHDLQQTVQIMYLTIANNTNTPKNAPTAL